MVQEIRRITLDQDELLQAIEAHRRAVPKFLPGGRIARCAITPENQVSVTMEVSEGGTISSKTQPVAEVNLVESIIRFCLENNIMLPRCGNKSVAVEKDAVTLVVTLTMDADTLTRVILESSAIPVATRLMAHGAAVHR